MQPNKLRFSSLSNLNESDRATLNARGYALRTNPIPGEFDLAHLMAVHEYLYAGIYEDAGKLRQSNGEDPYAAIQRRLDTEPMGEHKVVHQHENKMREELPKALEHLHLLHLVVKSRPEVALIQGLVEVTSELSFQRPFRAGNRKVIEELGFMAVGHQIVKGMDQRKILTPRERDDKRIAIDRAALEKTMTNGVPLHSEDQRIVRETAQQYQRNRSNANLTAQLHNEYGIKPPVRIQSLEKKKGLAR